MTDKPEVKKADLYKDGLCQCMANMKGKHMWFNEHLHPRDHFSVYMCIRCNKPVYWPSPPYR